MGTTMIFGVGNEIMGNDALGLYILRELKTLALPKKVSTEFIGTNCWAILRASKFTKIIVIDAINTGGKEGETYYIPVTKILPNERPYSIHDLTWLEVVTMSGLKEKTFLFGIETNPLNMGFEISPYLKEKITFYRDKLYKIVISEPNR